MDTKQVKQIAGTEVKAHEKRMHKGMAKGGMPPALAKHAAKPASKAHAGLKTGGVVKGAGGYATGGVVNGQGGFKTGGVVNGQGGFKKGGGVKKFADGGLIDTGRAVKMPQGMKKPTPPVGTNQVAGTFKKGGGVKKFNGGGDAQSDKETKAYKDTYTTQKTDNMADRDALDIIAPIKRGIGTLIEKGKNFMGITPTAPGAVTKTKESVTVAPAKKRGGMAC